MFDDVYWSKLRGREPAVWVGEFSNGYSAEIEQQLDGYAVAVFREDTRLGGVTETSLACAKAAATGFVLGFSRAVRGAMGGT